MTRPRGALLGILAMLCACRGHAAEPRFERLDHGRFAGVRLSAAGPNPSGVVLWLSSDAPGSPGEAEILDALTRRGALVAIADAGAFMTRIAREDRNCSYAAGDIENLAHFIEAYRHLASYRPVILAGTGAGAALAKGAIAQSAPDTFAGAIAFGEEAALPPALRLCPASTPAGSAPSVHVEPERSIELPVEPDAPDLVRAYAEAQARADARAVAAPADLRGLPVIDVPAQGSELQGVFAVFLSGDGGWAGIDRAVAKGLSEHGVPVVGLDSLRYFWTKRTPDSMAVDVDRIIRFYSRAFHRDQVVLVGFSQGADVLPFIANRLPPGSAGQVIAVAAMAITQRAHFEFHIGNWLGAEGQAEILPEMLKLGGRHLACIHGQAETDSLCPKLEGHELGPHYRDVALPGGHHFNGNYRALSDHILTTIRAAQH